MTSYPTITLWQPWASLILVGAKPIEWRGWPAPLSMVGRRIGIHAGARKVRRKEIADLLDSLGTEEEGAAWDTSLVAAKALPLLERWFDDPALLPLSTVVCTAILGEPFTASAYARAHGMDSDRVDHTKYGWPLSDIEPVMPMAPARGFQGFWPWSTEAPA
jgi:hypothetical protein